jgi:isopenicillin N synthase-like dioxygenase
MASSIPSVDLSPFFVERGVVIGESATAEQQACAQAIDDACREHGFIHVTGFGLSPELYQRAFQSSKEFFDLPNETKLNECRPMLPAHNMGYTPVLAESTNPSRPPEMKEAFNVRFLPAHENDFRGCPLSFVETANDMQRMFSRAAHRYALACALALGLPIDFFDQTIEKMDLCTIRFLHYPPCDFESTSVSTEKPIRVGEHTDFGAFTFLLLGNNGAEGLQIKPVEGGVVGGEARGEDSGWLDVQVPSEGAIINTGALMARWTNDEWRATAHRVIVPSELEAGRHRYSIAFFVDPDSDALVTVQNRFVTQDKPCRYEPITGLAFLLMKLEETVANRQK